MSDARTQMVKQQVRTSSVVNNNVLNIMNTIPRDLFVPDTSKHLAYADKIINLEENQVMLSPRAHGLILQHIEPLKNDNVLLVGVGSGYLACCLSGLVKKITAIDKYSGLVGTAKKNAESLGITNIEFNTYNYFDFQTTKLFSKIIFTASVSNFRTSFMQFLEVNGKCFISHGASLLKTCSIVTKQSKDEFIIEDIFEDDIPLIEGDAFVAKKTL
jgi:protein-L-isoaspartate(D-aspartate) O-methyltransferase